MIKVFQKDISKFKNATAYWTWMFCPAPCVVWLPSIKWDQNDKELHNLTGIGPHLGRIPLPLFPAWQAHQGMWFSRDISWITPKNNSFCNTETILKGYTVHCTSKRFSWFWEKVHLQHMRNGINYTTRLDPTYNLEIASLVWGTAPSDVVLASISWFQPEIHLSIHYMQTLK